MKIILDTHMFLWALADPERIATNKRYAIETQANMVFVSTVSIAEIMFKASIGTLALSFEPLTALENAGFTALEFSVGDALLPKDMPFHHRDPFDRMLIAQSINRRIPLVSEDRRFTLYDCRLV